MPFSTDEKNNLRNDGKLTEAQIRFFETAQVNYDKIKVLQDIEKRFATLDEQDLPLGNINFLMISNIRPLVRDGIIPEDALDRYIAQQLEDIEEIEQLNQGALNQGALNQGALNQTEDYDTETETETATSSSSSIGGRRRRTRTKKSKRRRIKTRRRRGKKSRRMKRSR